MFLKCCSMKGCCIQFFQTMLYLVNVWTFILITEEVKPHKVNKKDL